MLESRPQPWTGKELPSPEPFQEEVTRSTLWDPSSSELSSLSTFIISECRNLLLVVVKQLEMDGKEVEVEVTCQACGAAFSSRNKLFKHLKLCVRARDSKDSDEQHSSSSSSSTHKELEDVLPGDTYTDVRLYCIGGRHRNKTLASTEFYSFRSKSWHDGPFLLENRGSHGSVSFDDGSIVVMSGGGLHSNLVTCEVLSFEGKEFQTLSAEMKYQRHALGVSRCGDLIFTVGGWEDGRQCSRDVEIFTRNNKVWEALPQMQLGRRLCGCVAVPGFGLGEFKLYVFGGQIDNSNHLGFAGEEKSNGWVTACAEMFDSRSWKWRQIKKLPAGGPTSVVRIGRDDIFVIVHGASVYKYCPGGDEGEEGNDNMREDYVKVASLPLQHWYCFDVCAFGRRIFFTGGSVHGRWSTAFYEFDTVSLEFLEREPMTKERRRGSCSVVAMPPPSLTK